MEGDTTRDELSEQQTGFKRGLLKKKEQLEEQAISAKQEIGEEKVGARKVIPRDIGVVDGAHCGGSQWGTK